LVLGAFKYSLKKTRVKEAFFKIFKQKINQISPLNRQLSKHQRPHKQKKQAGSGQQFSKILNIRANLQGMV
jgi:hypothetical protein